ncbi:PTPLA-domain-containing protein [Neoconidiobolus thromboides FSU 785]|nr:PTPLA-domain-containing protein [Neoconidiobolus thromboides FSU 785]
MATKIQKRSQSSKIKKVKRGPNFLIRLYLISYNIICATLWGIVLFNTVNSLIKNKGDFKKTYANAAVDLPIVQSLAILEIFHSLFRFVRSPLLTTIMQVFSRLLLAVGIVYFFPIKEVTEHWALTSMTLAWCITEVIRYLYYFFGLIGYIPGVLEWCRYTFFYVLYPIGASSEVIVAYQARLVIKDISLPLYYALLAILCFYPFGFIQLYTYMIKQRSKYLADSKKDN